MSKTRETLRAQLAVLRAENERLTEELLALHERTNPAREDTLELPAKESEVLFETQRQANEDLQAELNDTNERCRELDKVCDDLHTELRKLRDEADLERLRAVEAERNKWEAREERLVKQLEELQSRLTEKNRSAAMTSPRVRTATATATERDRVVSPGSDFCLGTEVPRHSAGGV